MDHPSKPKYTKNQLYGLIDDYLLDQLPDKTYYVERVNATSLLTANRLDVAFRLACLDYLTVSPKLAFEIYMYDIKAQSYGSFSDPHNPAKITLDDFYRSFLSLHEGLNARSFDPSKSIVPLARDGSILNGSHRCASLAKNNRSLYCLYTDLPPVNLGARYYYSRKVPPEVIGLSASTFAFYSPNTYTAILWPSSRNYHQRIIRMLNPLYKRTIDITRESAFALLYMSYKHMDWIDTGNRQYTGIFNKMYECFPTFSPVTILSFTAPNIEEVIRLKQSIRELVGIGFSSIHITDTSSQAYELATLAFHHNQLTYIANTLSHLATPSSMALFLDSLCLPFTSPFSFFTQSSPSASEPCTKPVTLPKSIHELSCLYSVQRISNDTQFSASFCTEYLPSQRSRSPYCLFKATIIIHSLGQYISYLTHYNLYWSRRLTIRILRAITVYDPLKRFLSFLRQ